MAIDIAKVRAWARKSHQDDDASLTIAWEAATRELEMRTGWCAVPVVRTQYVPVEPTNDERMVRLERQPCTACTYLVNNVPTAATLVLVNGIHYAKLPAGLTYPLLLTVSAGNTTLNPLLEMALLQRTIQLEASRGDDTVTLPGDYWGRITAMLGKGIG